MNNRTVFCQSESTCEFVRIASRFRSVKHLSTGQLKFQIPKKKDPRKCFREFQLAWRQVFHRSESTCDSDKLARRFRSVKAVSKTRLTNWSDAPSSHPRSGTCTAIGKITFHDFFVLEIAQVRVLNPRGPWNFDPGARAENSGKTQSDCSSYG